jgi:hypothetical protein
MEELRQTLTQDLKELGIPTDFELCLKGYSKSYNGRYDPNVQRVTIFVYEDEACTKLLPYGKILRHLIHESTHHYQWFHDSTFERVKGQMHNADFKKQEQAWVAKARMLNLFDKSKEECLYVPCFA